MSKIDNIRNRIVSAVCIGVVLLAIVPLAGCPSTPQAPPAYVLQWGSYGIGNGQFNDPYDVAVDTAGNVYVTDWVNNCIQKFDSNGGYLTQWGSYGSNNGQFFSPTGIAVDAAGNVYVLDQGNHRIQKFGSNGVYLTQWGSYGTGNGQFNDPRGVAVDAAGNVYVSDSSNNRIQKFSNMGVYLTQWGTPGSGNGQFNQPYGIAVDAAGNVYVADTFNNRIQKFSNMGVYLTQWGSTVAGSGNGQFNLPNGVAVDSTGKIYVDDTFNNRIQKFTSTGGYLTQWGIQGAGNGQFNQPWGLAVDSTGNVYVADTFNHRIQKFGKSSIQVRTGTIIVNAILDGSPWTGPVNFTLTGQASGTLVPTTYASVPVGNYSLAYTSGGPSGASFVGITPTGTQTLTAGGTITYTLNFVTKTSVSTGTITVNAILDGSPWTGAVGFALTGPSPISGTSVPQTYASMPVGAYTIGGITGGPSGATLLSTTPNVTQTLTAGGTITYTLNFRSNKVDTGTVAVNATLDGSPWTGAVGFTLTGPSPITGTSVPLTTPNMSVGAYTLTYTSGGPPSASFVNIMPSATQTLAAGGTITFTLNFKTKTVETGTIIVNATQLGPAGKTAWSGAVNFTLFGGSSPISGISVLQTYPNMPVGAYTLAYVSGGPPGESFAGITTSATQTLTAGGTITFTINFQ